MASFVRRGARINFHFLLLEQVSKNIEKEEGECEKIAFFSMNFKQKKCAPQIGSLVFLGPEKIPYYLLVDFSLGLLPRSLSLPIYLFSPREKLLQRKNRSPIKL